MGINEYWPPNYFAVLLNGDGLEHYLRPSQADESVEQFAHRIGELVARGMESPIGTVFIDAIHGTDGSSDAEVGALIVQSMKYHGSLRDEQKARLSAHIIA